MSDVFRVDLHEQEAGRLTIRSINKVKSSTAHDGS